MEHAIEVMTILLNSGCEDVVTFQLPKDFKNEFVVLIRRASGGERLDEMATPETCVPTKERFMLQKVWETESTAQGNEGVRDTVP